MKKLSIPVSTLLFISVAQAQQSTTDLLFQEPVDLGEGWSGFTDIGLLANVFLTLVVATVLGAIIAHHPKHKQRADTMEEIEASHVYIIYSMIGAIVGILVVKYGLVVGFVLFGIGGLIRFRTSLRSTRLTGRLIFVTLIGLSCGLNLVHVAVLVTLFGFVLIYILDSRVTYLIEVKALPTKRVQEAANAYRAVLEKTNCRVVSEDKRHSKGRVAFIIQASNQAVRRQLEELFETEIEEDLRGSVDWEID